MSSYYLSKKLTLAELSQLGIDFDFENLKSNLKLHIPNSDIKIFECQFIGLSIPKKLPKTSSIIEISIQGKPISSIFDSFDQIDVHETEFVPFVYFRYKILLEMGITLNDVCIYKI